jgi:hypothetical protein
MSSILLKRIHAKDDTFSINSENNTVSLNVNNSGIEIGGATSGLTVAGGSITMKNNTSITSSTTSTSETTGAFQVSGGVGIAGNTYIGGLTRITNSTASTTASTGALIVTGGVGIAGALNVNGIGVFNSGKLRTTFSEGANYIQSGSTDYGSSSAELRFGPTFSGDFWTSVSSSQLYVSQSTASTSTSTGALVVSGGVGIAEDVYIGGLTKIANSTASTSVSTGALTVAGGVGISGDLSVGGAIVGSISVPHSTLVGLDLDDHVQYSLLGGRAGGQVFSGGIASGENLVLRSTSNQTKGGVVIDETTASTSATTGALVVAGGVGIAGQMSVDGPIRIGYQGDGVGAIVMSRSNGSFIPVINFKGLAISSVLNITNGSNDSGRIDFDAGLNGIYFSFGYSGSSTSRIFSVGSTVSSSSTTSGAFTVSGGVGIAGAAYIGGLTRVTNATASTSASTGALVVSGGVGISGAAYIGGLARVTNATASTSASTGALVVSGGVGISGDLNVGGNITATFAHSGLVGLLGDDHTQYMLLSGRADGQMLVGGAASGGILTLRSTSNTTKGRVVIDETTASVSTTTGALAVAGGVGISGNTYIGGLARVTDTTVSTSASTGALAVSGGVGIAGEAYIGGLTRITNSTASTSTSTGALTVSGGVGISGNLSVGDTLRIVGLQPAIEILSNSLLRIGASSQFDTQLVIVGDTSSSGDPGRMALRYKNYITFGSVNGSSETERIRITSSGNVGIGTAAPRMKSTVLDANAKMAIVSTAVGQASALYLGTPTLVGDSYKTAIIAQGIGSWGRSELHFCLNNNGSSIADSEDATIAHSRMVITPAGNVGIGTTAPTRALEVIGDISSSGNTTVSGNLGIAGSFDGVDSTPAILGITGLTNVTTVTGLTSNLVKLGNSRTLYATFEVAPAAANIKTLFTFELPGLSVLRNKYTVVGSIHGYDSSETALNNMNLIGDPVSGKAKIQFTSIDTGAHTIQINATYPYFMGRYVIFGQFDGKNQRANIYEMEVYDENNVNIANQSTPSATSISTGPVTNLIDGNHLTDVSTAFVTNQRFTLDFGKEVRISKITIINRQVENRAVQARLVVRDNLDNNVYYGTQIPTQLPTYTYNFENHPVQEF